MARTANESERTTNRLRNLAADDPESARRIAAAGDAAARLRNLGVAAGAGVLGGPAVASALRTATVAPRYGYGDSSKYYGYGYYSWFNFGYSSCYGFFFGFGYPCYYPFFSYCYWYPYWWYSYYYCYPYYYYPRYYSGAVYNYYYDDDDDDVVVIYADDDDDVEYVDEPVGEAAAPDSRLKQSLTTAAERYLTLGDQAFREGRYRDAVQFYAKAVEFAPGEGVLHLVLSDALFATGDYRYAAYSIRRAVELDPTLVDAAVDKHTFYPDPTEFDRQLARLELYVDENPDDTDAGLVLATNYLFGRRPSAAVSLLEGSLALSLRSDTAAKRVLDAARVAQYGTPVRSQSDD